MSRAGDDHDLLTAEGYQTASASDGLTGLARAVNDRFDLIVLDLMLPGKIGLEVCRELRQRGNDTAILMLTAKSQLTGRIVGVKLGGGDHLTKPFELPELLAKVEALLRRVQKRKLTPVMRSAFGNVEVDFRGGSVSKDARPASLAGKELELLRYLIDHAARWSRANNCWKPCGNTSLGYPPGQSMSMWPGYARSSKTTPKAAAHSRRARRRIPVHAITAQLLSGLLAGSSTEARARNRHRFCPREIYLRPGLGQSIERRLAA